MTSSAAHNSSSALPIIDISPFLARPSASSSSSSAAARAKCATSLAAACRDVGFFYLIGHGIPGDETSRVLKLARQFFLETSDADKARIARKDPEADGGGGDGARGYQRIGENVTGGKSDWHEAVDWYAEYRNDNRREGGGVLRGENLWPYRPEELKLVYEDYVERVKEVGTAVVRAMGMALGLADEEVFVKNTSKSFWVLRMIGYPGLPTSQLSARDVADEQLSCGEHTDYGCVTLLLTDETKGALQVRSKQGQWATVNPLDGAYVVNIGDMMERWTNGLWKSTLHRVLHRGDRYRVSVPFFFEPNWDATIKPLRECIESTGGEALYKQVTYGDHLMSKVLGNFA